MEINEVVADFLDRGGYKKSKKAFGSSSKVVDSRKLFEHRRRKGAVLKPKLSFDINLPNVETNIVVARVSEDPSSNSRNESPLPPANKSRKKKNLSEKAKKDAAFMAALKKLGFPESDAPYLYKNKVCFILFSILTFLSIYGIFPPRIIGWEM